jgi:hypothetical protein
LGARHCWNQVGNGIPNGCSYAVAQDTGQHPFEPEVPSNFWITSLHDPSVSLHLLDMHIQHNTVSVLCD